MTESIPSYASGGPITQEEFTLLTPRDRVLCSSLIIWTGKVCIIEKDSQAKIDTFEKFCPFIKENYGLEELRRILDDLYVLHWKIKMEYVRARRLHK
jgi:hypothetical protein